MAYTNLQLLRKLLADPFKYAFDQQTGDGVTTVFKLSHERMQDDTFQVFVDNSPVQETEFTTDLERGMITFDTAPADKKEVEIKYYFAAFSDEELTEFLALANDRVYGAMITCIDILLADASRQFDYSSGQTEMKSSQVFKNLKDLRAMAEKNLSKTAGGMKVVNRTDTHYKDSVDTQMDLSRLDNL